MTTDLISRLAGTLPSDLNATTPVAVVDYETYYSKEYSVKHLSYWRYCHHPLFDAYRVSIVTNTGIRWVGHPKDAPWDSIRDLVFISHNRAFDLNVHAALIENGVVPNFAPKYWADSMALVAFLRLPRALAKAAFVLYGFVHNKDIRDKDMLAKKWSEFSPELQARIDEYALIDGDLPLRIWTDHVNEWPIQERKISDLISYRGLRGVHVDREGLQADIDLMERVCFSALQLIPWCKDDPDASVSSKKNLEIECRRLGIDPPPSLSKEDPGLIAWENRYSEQYPFVRAMRDHNRTTLMLKKYKMIQSRIKDDGRFEYSLSYLGTATGRTSGTDRAEKKKSANMLNLARDPMLIRSDMSLIYRKDEMKEALSYLKKHKRLPEGVQSVYLRSKIVPAPGHKFVICDLEQIEARVTNWLARDTRTMDLIRSGVSVYEAHAIALMGYVPKPDPKNPGKTIPLKEDSPFLYSLAKARELALGFQAGFSKFAEMAKLYVSEEEYAQIFNVPYTKEQADAFEEYLAYTKQKVVLNSFLKGDEASRRVKINAWMQVQSFRKSKPGLVALWKKLDQELKRSAATGGMHSVVLPSWRSLKYFNIRMSEGTVIASTERGSDEDKYFYGGKILENCLGGDNEVLTEGRGWVPLRSLGANERVWDGSEYVAHAGLVSRGEQPVINCHGVVATPDHHFLTEHGWEPADCACMLQDVTVTYCGETTENEYSSHLVVGESTGESLRTSNGNPAKRNAQRVHDVEGDLRLREDDDPVRSGPEAQQVLRTRVLTVPVCHLQEDCDTQDESASSAQCMEGAKLSLLRSQGDRLHELRGSWNLRMPVMENGVPVILEGHGAVVDAGTTNRSHRYERKLRAQQLPLGYPGRKLPEQAELGGLARIDDSGSTERNRFKNAVRPYTEGVAPVSGVHDSLKLCAEVFDVLNCGPNRCFAVRSPSSDRYLIAHNCVQATARDVFVENQLRLADAGIHVVLDIYDEIVAEVDTAFDGRKVQELMTMNPSWARTLPIGASIEESMWYKK